MSRNFDYSLHYISDNLEKDLRECTYLGEGHNGVVFLLKDNRAIKIFKYDKVWKDESSILERVSKSRFFPKLYETGERYIVREFVDGICMDKYLRRNTLNKKLCEELYLMILDFEKLGFKRVDIRCKDIYIQSDFTLKIIDPKNNYKRKVPYPRHLLKGLYKRKELENFLEYVGEVDEERKLCWEKKFDKYFQEKNMLIKFE
ncbi:hypothetical protein [Clostridium sp. B9]|uniref:hypothetical protein n=1 Tax=Clostridium sp. B9 TaxID=3423224 RepID=UPI003D2EBE7C